MKTSGSEQSSLFGSDNRDGVATTLCHETIVAGLWPDPNPLFASTFALDAAAMQPL